jgi:hypothetical protein
VFFDFFVAKIVKMFFCENCVRGQERKVNKLKNSKKRSRFEKKQKKKISKKKSAYTVQREGKRLFAKNGKNPKVSEKYFVRKKSSQKLPG